MNRIQVACWGLIASAFILGGLLLAHLDGSATPRANASLVIARSNFTIMTAKTRDDEEALFVLENDSSKLLIYTLSLSRKRLELAGVISVNDIFREVGLGGAPAAGNNNNNSGGAAPRRSR